MAMALPILRPEPVTSAVRPASERAAEQIRSLARKMLFSHSVSFPKWLVSCSPTARWTGLSSPGRPASAVVAVSAPISAKCGRSISIAKAASAWSAGNASTAQLINLVASVSERQSPRAMAPCFEHPPRHDPGRRRDARRDFRGERALHHWQRGVDRHLYATQHGLHGGVVDAALR